MNLKKNQSMMKKKFFSLLKKYKVPQNKEYNIIESNVLDSLKLMNLIIDLEKIIKKKINTSELIKKKNQTVSGLIKFLKI
tara:strand:- start:4303 stop:4542 length:240 start_codon:yes stop_codon:yes gene_type:complete